MKADFYQKVHSLAKDIPKGQVATYGQLASIVSTPRAARTVGFALRSLSSNTDVPWQRVINSQGMISISNERFPKNYQAKLLQNEGIKVNYKEENYWVDLKKYLHNFS